MTHRAAAAPRIAAAAALATLAGSSAGAAATAAPLAAVAPGYAGAGTLVAKVPLAGVPLTVGGQIALEQRGSQLRVDVLSLAVPGTNAMLSSVIATQLFPPGGFTVVYDRAAADYVVWSTTKRTYFMQPLGQSAALAKPSAATSAMEGANDLLAPLQQLHRLSTDKAFAISLSLAGHGPVNGHPATGLDYHYARTTADGAATDLYGRIQLADDLGEVPVSLTASITSPQIPGAALDLELTSLARRSEPEADFVPPPGYARAASLGDVVGTSLGLGLLAPVAPAARG